MGSPSPAASTTRPATASAVSPTSVVEQAGRSVRDVPVRQADAQKPGVRQAVTIGEQLRDGRAHAAGQHAVLDRDEQLVVVGQLADQLGVQRLGEARIRDGDAQPVRLRQPVGRRAGDRDARAVAQQRDALARLQDLASADRDRDGRARRRGAHRRAARVAQRDRAGVVGERGVQHVDEHRRVTRRHEHDVRQAAQVGDVERSVMRRAVVADEAGAVDARTRC